MSIKVLIIGGTGFIGKNIIRRCIENRWKVFATYYRKKPNNKKIKSFFLDLANPKIPKKYNINFDHIFFSAGEIDHEDRNHEKVLNEHFYSILKITKKIKAKNFYYFSTADEYKSSKKNLVETSSKISLKTYYSLAKHLAGQYLLTLHKKRVFNVIIFRIFIVYGPGQNTNRLIPSIITSLANNQKFMILNSNLKKDFLFIDDFIDAVFMAIKIKKLLGRVVNVGSGKSISLKYLGNIIQRLVRKGKVNFKNSKSHYSSSQYSSIDLIKNNSNWKPQTSIKLGLTKTIESFNK